MTALAEVLAAVYALEVTGLRRRLLPRPLAKATPGYERPYGEVSP